MLRDILRRAFRSLRLILLVLALILVLQRSGIPLSDGTERVRFYTRALEFDYIAWTLNAASVKFSQSALGVNRYMDDAAASETVLEFIALTRRIQEAEAALRSIHADPAVEDKALAAADLNAQLAEDYALRAHLGPLAESILQSQVIAVLAEEGFTAGGQSIPPLLYHMTPAPMALIVSPRSTIRQENNISLQPEMRLEQQIALEEAVADGLDVSTLVVPIGGIGLYPTMVTQTSSITFLAEVVAHEWSHNYLSLRPLGASYFTTPALRTMNETAASIFGKEIGAQVVARYYPQFAPPPPEEAPGESPPEPEPEPPAFDFRAEMRETRLNADALLAAGEIERAELYMELRRRFFWDHGYRIRKLNQAYFAFYGAYADQPGGAAGDDPVAAAVRRLRGGSESLRSFMARMAWMTSYEDLLAAAPLPD